MNILDSLFSKHQTSKGILCGGTKRKKEKHYVINVFKGTKWACVCRVVTCKRYVNDEELKKLAERMKN